MAGGPGTSASHVWRRATRECAPAPRRVVAGERPLDPARKAVGLGDLAKARVLAPTATGVVTTGLP